MTILRILTYLLLGHSGYRETVVTVYTTFDVDVIQHSLKWRVAEATAAASNDNPHPSLTRLHQQVRAVDWRLRCNLTCLIDQGRNSGGKGGGLQPAFHKIGLLMYSNPRKWKKFKKFKIIGILQLLQFHRELL